MSASSSSSSWGIAASDRFDEAFLRKLEALNLVAKRARGGGSRAERRSRRVGAGIELADHRTYAPGDDARAIDWNLYARLDRPFVRLREEDEDLALDILVDGSASMGLGAPPKLDLGARVGAALAYIGLASSDRVRVSVIGDGVRDALPALRGTGSAARVLAMLGRARAAGATNLAHAARDVLAARRTRRRGLAVLISDLFDPDGCRAALDQLRAARVETVVIHIVARGDAPDGPGAPDGDAIIEDVETGATHAIEITPSVRRAGADRYASWLRGVASFCRERHVPCFQVPSDMPFEDVVLRLLRAGHVLS